MVMSVDELLDAPTLGTLQPLRILLVDDEPTTLQLVRRLLQADGHEIFEAVDGEQAITLFEKVHPDLVLLDVVIPKKDGLEVLTAIRQRDRMAGVIMVSALSSEQLAVKSMLGGADDYVGKPFRLKAIRMSIRQVMEKVRLRRHNATLQAELVAANQRLRKYMSEPLVHSLLKSPTAPELGGEREVITVLFLDFADFTSMAEQMLPDNVVHILNDYYSLLTSVVTDAGGYLDKIMGDGFMVLFNAPMTFVDHATRAANAAAAMRRLVVQANHHRAQRLSVRIGIHTGEAVVGNIGTSALMNYTAIGATVNTAKRIEEACKPDEILISGEAFELMDQSFLQAQGICLVPGGARQFKGRSTPMVVYSLEETVHRGPIS
ncbi:MAG: response regulator [Anaerolineales bacterium]|nr:response regulator [Anaerolineales bacterium]